MKIAMLRPLLTGSWYTSAQMPPTTLIAHEPPTPTNKRKITRAAKFGATAEAIEKTVNSAKEAIMVHLRPYDSLIGPHIIGPPT